MNWRKILLVARREFLFNLRRPSFLFSAFGVPIISMGAMFIIVNLTGDRETSLKNFKRIDYVDRAVGRAPVITVTDPTFNPDNFQPVTLPNTQPPAQPDATYYDSLETEASRLLRDGKIDAYFVLPDTYLYTGQVELYSRKNPPVVLNTAIKDFLRDQIAEGTKESGAQLAVSTDRLAKPLELTIRDVDTGKAMTETELMGRFMMPILFVLVYFMATTTTAQFLMSGVVEEKENRLMEILATSLKPVELLWGKVLGLGALSMTQILFWGLAGAIAAVTSGNARDFLSSAQFRAGDILIMVVLFVINFLLFSAMMMGIGASVTAEAESRQIAGFLTFLGVAPMVFSVTFFTNPNGPVPVFFTFFPLTSAVAIILRLGLGSIPMWQVGLCVLIQIAAMLAIVWLAAKVFRMGMLMYGKMLTPRTLWAALREGQAGIITTPTELNALPAKKKKQKRMFRL